MEQSQCHPIDSFVKLLISCVRSCVSRTTFKLDFFKKNAKSIYLDFSCVNVNKFYMEEENGSGIQNMCFKKSRRQNANLFGGPN